MELPRLDFDTLELRTAPVKIAGAVCMLFEATAAIVAAYDNERMRHGVVDDEGKFIKFEKLADLRAFAVHKCLIRMPEGGTLPPPNFEEATVEPLRFPLEAVRAWPDRVVDPLFDACKEMAPTLTGGKVSDPKGSQDDGTPSSSTPTS